ncbi:hypothetical protein [Streptomyces sp. NPDC058757]|uniref:MmyB family transcriptional regulator n=1 Tax=Streptomyces sp. NPDC058757 TaxID=3346626 RepID=UPI003680A655
MHARTRGRKTYRHPLVGPLEFHQENFALPEVPGTELLVLWAAPAGPSEDGLRLLAGLAADGGVAPLAVRAREPGASG